MLPQIATGAALGNFPVMFATGHLHKIERQPSDRAPGCVSRMRVQTTLPARRRIARGLNASLGEIRGFCKVMEIPSREGLRFQPEAGDAIMREMWQCIVPAGVALLVLRLAAAVDIRHCVPRARTDR